MKELTKYSRLAGYLEKLYDKLNSDFFNGDFDRPVITIQSLSLIHISSNRHHIYRWTEQRL